MPVTVTTNDLQTLLRPGMRVYVPGSSGTPQGLWQWLEEQPGRSAGLHITTSAVPGINPLALDRLAPDAVVNGMFMQPGFALAQRQGRYRFHPASYAGFVRQLQQGPDFDLSIIQVSPPDAEGHCSLGPLVEFTPLAMQRSRRILAIVNPQVPAIAGAAGIGLASIGHVLHDHSALATYATQVDDASAQAIAGHLANLIGDHATVQLGLGNVPSALYQALSAHRQLRLHSGMFSDGLLDLARSGALDPNAAPTTCALVGSQAFYQQAAQVPGLRVLGCEYTHDLRVLLAQPRFHAVNSALEVDLFGQCNLEHAGGRAVSGAGGAPDFARAARLCVDGRSIIALNATYGSKAISRIVPALPSGAISSLPRCDIDCVVTEYGVAHLHGASVHERARALIDIAAPQHRDALATAWDSLAAQL